MNRMDNMTYTIGYVRTALMEQWKTNAELRKVNDILKEAFDFFAKYQKK